MLKPSSVSKFGIEEGSCFLCGGTVFSGLSTAASAMAGDVCDVSLVVKYQIAVDGRSESGVWVKGCCKGEGVVCQLQC